MDDIANTETGEVLVNELPVKFTGGNGGTAIVNPYNNIAKAPFSDEAQKALNVKIDPKDVEIKPDGIIYLPGVKYRNILHKAFGQGAWALLPKNIYFDESESRVFYHAALFVNGQFVSESIGEQRYIKNNENMSYATAVEGAKTDCMTRCCKDLGIAAQLWDPRFIKEWKEKNAVAVWCEGVAQNNKGKKKQLWRRKDDPPLEYPWKEQNGKQQSQQKAAQSMPKSIKTFEQKCRESKKWLFDKLKSDERYFEILMAFNLNNDPRFNETKIQEDQQDDFLKDLKNEMLKINKEIKNGKDQSATA